MALFSKVHNLSHILELERLYRLRNPNHLWGIPTQMLAANTANQRSETAGASSR